MSLIILNPSYIYVDEEAKDQNMDQMQSDVNFQCLDSHNPSSSGSDPKHLVDNSEFFYQKLSHFYDSYGLNLVFNVRQTELDLHFFYKEVTGRGGFYNVTKDKRWEEVARALKLERINVNYAHQLQRLYEFFLYQFEQIYGADVSGGNLEKKPSPHMQSRMKDQLKKPSVPLKSRNAYQIFIKKECDRLRNSRVERQKGQSFLSIAIDAWKCLPESDKQKYIEESKKEKERFSKKKNAYKEQDTKNSQLEDKQLLDDDYHVLLQPAECDRSLVPDQSAIDYALEMMKNSPDSESLLHLELE